MTVWWRVLLGGSLVALLVAGCGKPADQPKPPKLIQSGKVCGMIKKPLVDSLLGTTTYKLATSEGATSRGLSSTKEREAEANTCYLSTARSGHVTGWISVSQTQPPDTYGANITELRNAARDSRPTEGCAFSIIKPLGPTTLCMGSKGARLRTALPTTFVGVANTATHAADQKTRSALIAAARDLTHTLATQGVDVTTPGDADRN